MKKLIKVLVAVILSALLALILVTIVGLFTQSAGLAALLFLPLFGFCLWRSLRAPSTSKVAGNLLGLTGISLMVLPVAVAVAVIAAVVGGFGSGSGHAGGAIAVALLALVVGGFIVFVPVGIVGSVLGIFLRERRGKHGIPEIAEAKASNPSIERPSPGKPDAASHVKR